MNDNVKHGSTSGAITAGALAKVMHGTKDPPQNVMISGGDRKMLSVTYT